MRIEFLREQLKEFWESNCLEGGFSIDYDKGEIIIRTDCMVCPETKHIVQYNEKLIKNQS